MIHRGDAVVVRYPDFRNSRVILSTDLSHLSVGERWTGLKAIGMVEAERHGKGKVSRERRYYITSLDDMELFHQAVRFKLNLPAQPPPRICV